LARNGQRTGADAGLDAAMEPAVREIREEAAAGVLPSRETKTDGARRFGSRFKKAVTKPQRMRNAS
jgi:hypothetical protein